MCESQATVKTTWTDKDWDKITKWLSSILKSNTVTITFTKKDGTERVMNCTLNPELLPPPLVTEGTEAKKERKVNDSIMSVYDTDANGWRSFTIKSLKHISLTI